MYVSASSRWDDRILQVPGDFPLSSNRSRAAARALLAERQNAYQRREVIISYRAESPHVTDWRFDVKEHSSWRDISILSGMTVESGLRALVGFWVRCN
jgi:hypothetical protein